MTKRYRTAAVGYFIYGAVYLTGALFELTPERQRSFHGIPWWAFYVAGGLLLVPLPLLVGRGRVWLTRILTLGPAAKALTLCFREGRHLAAGDPPRPFEWLFI